MKGNAIAQLKPVTVIGNELQKKFFLNLVDDFEEIKALSAHRYCICKIQGRLQIFVIVLLCGLSILFSGVGNRVLFLTLIGKVRDGNEQTYYFAGRTKNSS